MRKRFYHVLQVNSDNRGWTDESEFMDWGGAYRRKNEMQLLHTADSFRVIQRFFYYFPKHDEVTYDDSIRSY